MARIQVRILTEFNGSILSPRILRAAKVVKLSRFD